jgi:hypothetical protein
MIFDSNKFNQLSLGCFLNVFHSVFNMLNLLRSPGLIPRPLGRKNCAAGNGFAKLFSKASPIPRPLAAGIIY